MIIGRIEGRHREWAMRKLESRCHEVLVKGYTAMKRQKEYACDQEEEQLTAVWCDQISRLKECNDYLLDASPEPRLYTPQVLAGIIQPKQAAKADIRMSIWYRSWRRKQKLVYVVEAKNVSVNNWTKPSGARVNAQASITRYIKTGIDSFCAGKYSPGCLVAYVVNGEAHDAVALINLQLTNASPRRSSETLGSSYPIEGYRHCHWSTHAGKVQEKLLHLVLELQ